MEKIKNFTDLIAYQKAHILVLEIYLLTKEFPNEEKFSLVDQIKRSSISITSNIAEGFSRKTSKDKIHFYLMAKGSLTEVHSQLMISKDLKYIKQESFNSVELKLNESARLISGLMKSAQLL